MNLYLVGYTRYFIYEDETQKLMGFIKVWADDKDQAKTIFLEAIEKYQDYSYQLAPIGGAYLQEDEVPSLCYRGISGQEDDEVFLEFLKIIPREKDIMVTAIMQAS